MAEWLWAAKLLDAYNKLDHAAAAQGVPARWKQPVHARSLQSRLGVEQQENIRIWKGLTKTRKEKTLPYRVHMEDMEPNKRKLPDLHARAAD
jgi:hypothetical protein